MPAVMSGWGGGCGLSRGVVRGDSGVLEQQFAPRGPGGGGGAQVVLHQGRYKQPVQYGRESAHKSRAHMHIILAVPLNIALNIP
jgi:hypothetical protein